MSDNDTKKPDIEIIRNRRLEAVNHLNHAIVDVVYISLQDCLRYTPAATQLDDIWQELAEIKKKLRSIKL